MAASLGAAHDGRRRSVDVRLGGGPRLDALATSSSQAGSALFNDGGGGNKAREEGDGEEDGGETHDGSELG